MFSYPQDDHTRPQPGQDPQSVFQLVWHDAPAKNVQVQVDSIPHQIQTNWQSPVNRRVFSVPNVGRDVDGAKRTLRLAQAVCFDVDSTVCAEEGINVLADFCGAAEAVANLTNQAMGGSMLFQDALGARLDIMQPSRTTVDRCLRDHPPRLSPGVKEFIGLLQERGTAVYLVSGGFRQMINPVADLLGINRANIYANNLVFSPSGEYAGFDPEEPTSRDGGKPVVVRMLKDAFNYSSVVMIGDGATDLQAKPPANTFVGYGGVSIRSAVRQGADWFVTDFSDLIHALKNPTALAQ
ncbi:unnamed protein product [Choristocarpus tenellus]